MERDGQLLQAVLPADDARAAPRLQRRSLPCGDGEAALAALLEELAERPFELVGAGVPIRITLIAVGDDDHVLVVVNHHILRHGSATHATLAEYCWCACWWALAQQGSHCIVWV